MADWCLISHNIQGVAKKRASYVHTCAVCVKQAVPRAICKVFVDEIGILVSPSIVINVEDAIEETRKAGKGQETVRNQQILGSLRAGWNAKKVADKYRLSYSWTIKLCKRLLKGERGERKPGPERPEKKSIQEVPFLIREASREPP